MTKITFHELENVALSELVTRQRVTGEQLELIHYTYQPGATFATHAHEAEQLTLVLSGVLTFVFDDGGEPITLCAGDGLLIPSWRPHGAFVPEDAGETRTYNIFTPVRSTLPSG